MVRVGESESSSRDELEQDNVESDLTRGIYSNKDGELFEVITNALSGEDFEPLVVYRELFGDYRFLLASPENFGVKASRFTLVKAL